MGLSSKHNMYAAFPPLPSDITLRSLPGDNEADLISL